MSDEMETTMVIVKPDAVQRKLIGRILARFEEKGFQIIGLKMTTVPEATIRSQYAQHEGKPFYEPLVRYMSDAPVVLIALHGKNAVEIARRMMGETFGSEAAPGTIRGDYALSNRFNLVHGADSAGAARKEIKLFFKPEELLSYEASDEGWVYDKSGADIV